MTGKCEGGNKTNSELTPDLTIFQTPNFLKHLAKKIEPRTVACLGGSAQRRWGPLWNPCVRVPSRAFVQGFYRCLQSRGFWAAGGWTILGGFLTKISEEYIVMLRDPTYVCMNTECLVWRIGG